MYQNGFKSQYLFCSFLFFERLKIEQLLIFEIKSYVEKSNNVFMVLCMDKF